jgi:uncharacterized iron-regulated membrane protein
MTPERNPTRTMWWRVHGLAALLATPFLIAAAITGLIYVPTPQVEAWRQAAVHSADDPHRPWLPLDALVAAARAAAPDHELRHVLPPQAPGSVMKAVFEPLPRAAHGPSDAPAPQHVEHARGAGPGPLTVYVEPGSARVLGTLHEMERFGPWAKRLHSQLLLGENWRWMIEWAATCLLVMLISGAVLAWPQRGQPVWPRGWPRAGQARAVIKQWHVLIGLVAVLMSLAIVLTGLTWSRFAGAQIRELRDVSGQAPPRAPATLRSTPPSAQAQPLTWQAVWDLARRHAPDVALQLTAPRVVADAARGARIEHGVWRAASADTRRPFERFETHFDAYSGRVLFHAGWAEQTAFARATAIGIPFHRGEFGLWNQIVLAVFGVTVLFSTLTGWLMWWRRPRGSAFGLPSYSAGGAAPRVRWFAVAAALGLAWLVPMLMLLALPWLALEWRARHRHAATAH